MKCSKLLCLGMAVVLACSGLPQMTYQTYGQTVEKTAADENGFQINDQGVLTKYTGSATDVVIPEGVTSIGNSAFYNCGRLTSVSIPKGVTSIGDSAFYNCESLTSVNIPEGVTSIGEYAFAHCKLQSINIPEGVISIGEDAFASCKLQSINIPEGVQSIGNYAFTDCQSCTEVTIPQSLKNIGIGVFARCFSLTKFNIPEGDDTYICYDGSLYRKTDAGLELLFFSYNKRSEAEFLEGVTGIWGGAFYGCRITSVEIPEGVTNIGAGAFSDCISLTSVTIPEGVTSIEESAFWGCNLLKHVSIPKSVTEIGKMAFYYCNGLENLTIPEGVTSIGVRAFYACSSLTNIVIPETVISIENNAFQYCRKLPIISIPKSVTSIGDSAFESCESLTTVTIPENVASIGRYTFMDCKSLTAIIIPENVTSIGRDVFSGCENVTIYGKSGSCAQTYAQENSIPFSELTELSGCQIDINETKVAYNGEEQKAGITVRAGDVVLTEGTDYEVVYENNVNVGTASVTINGKGIYTGSITKTFLIVPADEIDFEIDENGVLVQYTGAAAEPVIPSRVTAIGERAFADCGELTGVMIPEGVTGIGAYAFANCSSLESITIPESVASIGADVFEGCGELTVYAKEGSYAQTYALENNILFSAIEPEAKELSACQITITPQHVEYTGEPLNVTVTVKDGTDTLTEGEDYSVAYGDNVNVGTVHVTLTGMGKYTGSVERTFEIVKKEPETKELSACQITITPQQVEYTGEPLTVNVTVKDGTDTLTEGVDYSVAYANNVNVGMAEVTLTGKGKYTGSVERTFEIMEKEPEKKEEVVIEGGVFVKYNGTAADVVIPEGVTSIGKQAFFGCTGLKSVTIPESVTQIEADAFDSGTKLTIYGKEGSYAQEYAKKYNILFRAIGDSQTQVQTKELSSCQITVSPDKFIYNGKEQHAAVRIGDGTKQLKEGTDYSVEYRNNINAGTAQVILVGKGAYKGTVSKDFMIEQAPQELSYTKSYKKTYGNKPFQIEVGRKTGDGGLTYKSSNEKVVYAAEDGKVTIRNTGTAIITVSAKATQNYKEASVKITVDVRPAKQTVKKLNLKKGRKLTISWKKDTKATGYEVWYSTDKKFKKGVKKLSVKKSRTISKTVAKLAKGKRYYVKVRAYKSVKVNGKTEKLYGAWSAAKRSGKIKK